VSLPCFSTPSRLAASFRVWHGQKDLCLVVVSPTSPDELSELRDGCLGEPQGLICDRLRGGHGDEVRGHTSNVTSWVRDFCRFSLIGRSQRRRRGKERRFRPRPWAAPTGRGPEALPSRIAPLPATTRSKLCWGSRWADRARATGPELFASLRPTRRRIHRRSDGWRYGQLHLFCGRKSGCCGIGQGHLSVGDQGGAGDHSRCCPGGSPVR
jgi:hypothetical protein